MTKEEIEKQIDEFIYEYQQDGMLPSIAKQRIINLLDQQTKQLQERVEYMKHALENDVIHINKLQAKIDELEKENKCNECGKILEKGSVFCSVDCRLHYYKD